MVSLQEQETLQLRALKLLTPIKGTFPLYTLPLRRSLSPLRSIEGRGKDGWKDKRAFSLSPPAARFANGAAATFLVDADVRSRINETFKTPGKKGRSFGVRQPGVKHRPEIINGGQDPRGWTED